MTIQAHQKIGMRGFFHLQAHQEDDAGNIIAGSTRELGQFENLILDNGMELFKGSYFMHYIAVGSGSTPPATTDTQLQALVASKSGGESSQGPNDMGADPAYISATQAVQFSKGDAAGNLSEIGVGTSATSLFSRALIKDASGNPTTITVLAIELLTVTYELRLYIDLAAAPVTDSVVIDGVTYTTTTIIGRVDAGALSTLNSETDRSTYTYFGTGALGAPGQEIQGGSSGGYADATVEAPAGQYYWDVHKHLGVNDQNNDITAVSLAVGRYERSIAVKTGFSPALPKDNTKELDITMRLEYGRYQAP